MSLEKALTVKVPDALGDTVTADAFLQFLGDNGFPNLTIVAKNPELLENRGYELTAEDIPANVDLNGYLDQLIHVSEPPKTIRWYMANHGIQQLWFLNRPDFDETRYLPKITLTPEEEEWGWSKVNWLKKEFGRAVIPVSFESSGQPNRTWPEEHANELFKATIKQATYIEFVPNQEDEHMDENVAKVNYKLRQVASVLNHADGIITVDTFLLHAAAAARKDAAGQKTIIGLFGSSRPETLDYPGVYNVMDGENLLLCQYCGNHGYSRDLTELEKEIKRKVGWSIKFGKNSCIYPGNKIPCMRAITPDKVIGAVRDYLLQP